MSAHPRARAGAALVALAALIGLAGIGCNLETLDEFPCPTGGTTLTYVDFGRPFMAEYCDSCHSAPDGSRNGAPDDFVFETQADLQEHAARIFARAADTNDSMPPGPDAIPAEARKNLAIWLACGAK